ncbi:hypothetical protein V6N13_008013 [Hibiscus sabdariffa]
MEPLRKQRNLDLIKDPNTFLGASISSDEIWKYEKVNTDDNIVNPLTRPLTQQKHDRHTKSLRIRYAELVLAFGLGHEPHSFVSLCRSYGLYFGMLLAQEYLEKYADEISFHFVFPIPAEAGISGGTHSVALADSESLVWNCISSALLCFGLLLLSYIVHLILNLPRLISHG